MTAQIAAYWRLVDDPQTKQTSKGAPMTLARMAVSLPCSQLVWCITGFSSRVDLVTI